MRIVSTFLPAAHDDEFGRRTQLFVFDTLVDEKSLVLGVTVGAIQGPTLGDVRCSPIGQKIVGRLSAHHVLNYPDGVVILAGVQSVGTAKQRVRKVLADAPHQAAVLFLCADSKVYDAVTPHLGIDYQSADPNAQ
ncbi:hypothetical protein HFK83_02555 [Ralstonia pseudosolanacearum]|uniref:hypothetical protein n=1 Tax=Ralstonia solanacearum species complex TaxID=3116862 RepID=UPI002006D59A|nr:hypothetical protein [Ralstonia pseudosolanacearum]MCK4121258.1 hypothetical protein [Ralstonia pseudosolanacearum]